MSELLPFALEATFSNPSPPRRMSRPIPIMVLQEVETIATVARTMIDSAFMPAWLSAKLRLCKRIYHHSPRDGRIQSAFKVPPLCCSAW